MRRLLIAALLLTLLAVPSSSQEKKKKREPDPLMMKKLKESQNLLEGLALNDPAKVQASAEELLRDQQGGPVSQGDELGQVRTAREQLPAIRRVGHRESQGQEHRRATLAYLEA